MPPAASNRRVLIRKLEPRDFEALLTDLNPWRFKKKGRVYPEWLHQAKPLHRVSWIATLNGSIIGYYGTLTIPLKIGGRLVCAYRGGPFVHPAYRGRGVFKRLTRAVFDETKKRKGAVYIFPTPRIVNFFVQKMRCVRLKSIPRYIYVFRIAPNQRSFSKKKGHASALTQLFIKEIHAFDNRFNTLWEKASRAHKIISMRNAEYLNWRYFKEPGNSYAVFAAEKNRRILGYIILRPADRKLRGQGAWVVDLLDIRDPAVTKALLNQAIQYFDAEGADSLQCYLADPYYEKILKSVGFLKRPSDPKDSEVLVAKCNSPVVSKSAFAKPENWFITTADMLFA